MIRFPCDRLTWRFIEYRAPRVPDCGRRQGASRKAGKGVRSDEGIAGELHGGSPLRLVAGVERPRSSKTRVPGTTEITRRVDPKGLFQKRP